MIQVIRSLGITLTIVLVKYTSMKLKKKLKLEFKKDSKFEVSFAESTRILN